MKFLLVILLFASSSFSQSQDKIPLNIQEKLNKAKDYYDIHLFDESKKILVELLYSEDGKKYEAEIRYHMGIASYFEENFNSAFNQWKQVIKKYPTSERSKELSRTFAGNFRKFSEDEVMQDENFEYTEDYKTAKLFWKSIPLDHKLFFGDLQNVETAVKLYEELIVKYDDPNKKFNFLSHLFLLYSGYNGSYYGYRNGDYEMTGNPISDKDSEKIVIEILSQMESYVDGENDINFATLVQCYYLWGVRRSNSKLFSGKVKVNKKSKPYFEKVIELTENNKKSNIYRIFSEHWLSK